MFSPVCKMHLRIIISRGNVSLTLFYNGFFFFKWHVQGVTEQAEDVV